MEKRKRRTEKKSGIKYGEKKKQLEIAKKLLERGEKIEEIVNITGLSENEIEKLK